MSSYYLFRLTSVLHSSHQVILSEAWATAIRKQARLSLLPLFRSLTLEQTVNGGSVFPQVSELGQNLIKGFFDFGSIHGLIRNEVGQIVSGFVKTQPKYEIDVLKFYFLSSQIELEKLFKETLEREDWEEMPVEEVLAYTGKSFQQKWENLSQEELMDLFLEELIELGDIFSNSDCENGLDAESIPRINKAFSNYLDLPYGVVSLIPLPINEYDFWECEFSVERTTIKKQFHTPEALEWKKCWQLANGEIRVKGNLDDPEDCDNATIQFLKKELTKFLLELETEIKSQFGIEVEAIQYTFFTRRRCEKGLNLSAGITFFSDEVRRHGADDFEPKLNIEIQTKQGQKLGTQLSLGPDQIHYLEKDQSYEHRVWVFHIRSEQFQLETKVGAKQRKKLIKGIIEEILNIGEN